MTRRAVLPLLAVLAACGCRAHLAVPLAERPAVWDFASRAEPLRASSGDCALRYYDPAATRWYEKTVLVGPASSFGLPSIEGRDPEVLSLPATSPSEGFTVVRPGRGPSALANYTLVFDLLLPASSAKKYFALFQTDMDNKKDANFFVKDALNGGIGFGGAYHGTFRHGEWNRVAVAVHAENGYGGVGHVEQYIDGRFVGGANTPYAAAGEPWRIGPAFHLFTDNDGDSAPAYVRGVAFVERALDGDEIARLGGPSAAGPWVPGAPPPPYVRSAPRRAELLSHRGGCGSRPENTLASIRHGFESGGDHAEVDVQLSADGVAFLMHDQQLDRTTDGHGDASALTMTELKRLDAGGLYDARYRGEPVPTLAEALRAANGRGRLLLDVKDLGMGKAIRRALDDAGVGPGAIWIEQNADSASLQDFRANVPDCEVLWMAAPADLKDAAFQDLKARGVVGLELEIGTFSKEIVARAHENGLKVYTFTIFDEQGMNAALELGVDGFETDYPGYFDKLMPARASPPPSPTAPAP